MAHRKVVDPLRNWLGLNSYLLTLSRSADAKSLLDDETEGKKRRNFLERIHQRYCALRALEERELLLKGCKPAKKRR